MKISSKSILVLTVALLNRESALAFTQPSASFVNSCKSNPANLLSGKSSISISPPSHASSKTDLQMSMGPTGLGALAGVVSGGLLGGALHAIAGKHISFCIHSIMA